MCSLERRNDAMRGKIVLITGANSGVGFVTARELARMGACVLMVCRDTGRGARARVEVAKAATGPAPELLLADMSSQSSVRALADDVRRRFAKIDVLIIIFTFDLAKRLRDTAVTVNCLSPGPTRTRFGDNMTGLPGLFPRLAKRLFPSPEKGARTLIHVASSPAVAGVSGRFFLRQRDRQTKPVTRDAQVAARLWGVSADLVGLPGEPRVARREIATETSPRSAT
jgi:NAD(P)-dependent dehydrogenase (short-subunit alcohol dehydrogenase family)